VDLASYLSRIAAELDLVAARVAAARRGGANLDGLDAEVERLCRQLETAPRELARRELPALQTLLVELDLLAADIGTARGAR